MTFFGWLRRLLARKPGPGSAAPASTALPAPVVVSLPAGEAFALRRVGSAFELTCRECGGGLLVGCAGLVDARAMRHDFDCELGRVLAESRKPVAFKYGGATIES